MKYSQLLTSAAGAVFAAGSAFAQSFGPSAGVTSQPAVQDVKLPSAVQTSPERLIAPAVPAVNDKVSIQSGLKPAPRTAGNKGKNAGEDIFMPQDTPLILFTKTTDGSKRGYVSMNAVDDKGNPGRSSSQIFLYYTDFRIDRSIGGQSTCDVRFFVNTNLNSRLINLDVKLVWPGMTTNLSFVDVPPNSPTYFDYALVGDGCYTMDKMPNIVVNRCRVKGMSSAECASKITWLRAIRKNN